MNAKSVRWVKYLIAVVAGNVLYFWLSPHLPARAQHHALLDWGTFVDLWFCLFVYGILELIALLGRRGKVRPPPD